MGRTCLPLWLVVILASARGAGAIEKSVASQNVAFELPDVVALESSPGGRYRLEAFKEKANDRLLDEGSAHRLRWVSLGRPRLVRTRRSEMSGEPPRLFHQQAAGFYASVDTLTEREAVLLAAAASRKYGVQIAAEQMLPLTPGRFECRLSLSSGRLLRASVFDFQALPLRLHFPFAPASQEHNELLNELKNEVRYCTVPIITNSCRVILSIRTISRAVFDRHL